MSKVDLYEKLNRASEISLIVKGRKSRKDIPRPVWFVHEGNTIYLLPNHGSDTNWYLNMLVDPTLKISVDGVRIPARGKPIKDGNKVDDILKKSKYGEVKLYETGCCRGSTYHLSPQIWYQISIDAATFRYDKH